MTGASARLFHTQVVREEAGSRTAADLPFATTTQADDVEGGGVERSRGSYKCRDDAYLVGDRVYNKQYAHLYFQRLQNLSPLVLDKVKAKWPTVPVRKILEVELGVECAVVGTVYKNMKLKPSVLDEYAKDKSLETHLASTKFVSGDDTLVLEDEGARMNLGCKGDSLDPADFVSGVCVAVRGTEEEGGNFVVKEVCLPGPARQEPVVPDSEAKYVALVSGLGLGDEKRDPLPLQLLADYVTGALGDYDGLAGKITRMVVVGNTLKEVGQVPMGEDKREASRGVGGLREADMFLTQIASSMPVDVMPGPTDPCNVSMPQQPLHRCLLPSTTCYSNVGRVTNPHGFEVDGVSFLGTSGQNIDDVMKYVAHEDRLGAMAATLEWCHSAPTAPDTLPCFPFVDQDPFVLKDCPHVYFAGNQPSLETGIAEGKEGQRVRLISLPSFAEKQTCVLVNLRDLSCHPIVFGSNLDQ
ncbi:small subunit of DNA polymerase delta [Chloropicon primus]|nr:small subunit of DNA polymerase delta [Chloropicon primus]